VRTAVGALAFLFTGHVGEGIVLVAMAALIATNLVVQYRRASPLASTPR
jgi:hypothetical protein